LEVIGSNGPVYVVDETELKLLKVSGGENYITKKSICDSCTRYEYEIQFDI